MHFFVDKLTQLEICLHDRRSRRSWQISSLGDLSVFLVGGEIMWNKWWQNMAKRQSVTNQWHHSKLIDVPDSEEDGVTACKPWLDAYPVTDYYFAIRSPLDSILGPIENNHHLENNLHKSSFPGQQWSCFRWRWNKWRVRFWRRWLWRLIQSTTSFFKINSQNYIYWGNKGYQSGE